MKRTQIMLQPQQYRRLRYLSSQANKSIAELIREAVDTVYKETEIKKKSEVVKKIGKMNLPVSSWEKMEEEAEGRLSQ